MQKVALGKTGVNVSEISLGCMLMGSALDRATSYEMLDRFVAAGGDFLDTANCYAWWVGRGEFVGAESETLVGQWLKERKNRDRVFLATKVGARLKDVKRIRDGQGQVYWDQVRQEYEYLSAQVIRQAVEDSLRRLQTDHIDLYYAHIDDRVTAQEETLAALQRLVEEGKVRFIACSNFRTWRLERARQISAARGWASYVAIQQQYSYLRPKPGADFGIALNADDELLDYLRCNEEVTLIAYSPLLKGIYENEQKREAYYNWPLFNSCDAEVRLETLAQLAQELGVSRHQLVLAWLLHQRPRVIPIVAASSLDQYEHNLQSLQIHLTDEQLAILNSATA
ncbi:pyridoxine 4-dehydrogenase [Thermoflexales bacterium]|nr:pyridoxine 4-dehydrogenase [Thermoflexales bacterium]